MIRYLQAHSRSPGADSWVWIRSLPMPTLIAKISVWVAYWSLESRSFSWSSSGSCLFWRVWCFIGINPDFEIQEFKSVPVTLLGNEKKLSCVVEFVAVDSHVLIMYRNSGSTCSQSSNETSGNCQLYSLSNVSVVSNTGRFSTGNMQLSCQRLLLVLEGIVPRKLFGRSKCKLIIWRRQRATEALISLLWRILRCRDREEKPQILIDNC